MAKKRRADGRYVLRYHGKYFYGKTQREAQDKLDAFKRAEADGLRAASRQTVASYAPQWLSVHKANVSDRTYNAYAVHIDRLVDTIGGIPLAAVTETDVQRVLNLYAGKSQSLIHTARMLMIDCFETAVREGYCRTNPARYATPPRGTAGSHRTLTDEERQLIETTPHRMRLTAMIMLYAGLRRGEALAIEPEDIDGSMIHVRRSVRWDSNAPILTDPKTEAGTRDVPILPQLRSALSEPDAALFRTRSGGFSTQIAFKRGWESYLLALSKAAGHPVKIRPHDLRHSYCTMLRDAGVDMHLAMQWLGHADEKMILRVYDHITDARISSALAKLSAAAPGSANGGQTGGQTTPAASSGGQFGGQPAETPRQAYESKGRGFESRQAHHSKPLRNQGFLLALPRSGAVNIATK